MPKKRSESWRILKHKNKNNRGVDTVVPIGNAWRFHEMTSIGPYFSFQLSDPLLGIYSIIIRLNKKYLAKVTTISWSLYW